MRHFFTGVFFVALLGFVGCGNPKTNEEGGSEQEVQQQALRDVDVVKDGVVPKSPPIQASDLDAPDPFQVVDGVPVYEVIIGDSLETVRANCEIFNETFYPKLNRRLLKIKTKELGASCINVYFICEDVVTQFEIIYEDPSMENADTILIMLRKRYGSKEKGFRSDEEYTRRLTLNVLEKLDVSAPENHYFNFDGLSGEMILQVSSNHLCEVSQENRQSVYDVAKQMITSCLKCPSTAQFQPLSEIGEADIEPLSIENKTDQCHWITDDYMINLWCEAENSFGAPVRTKYRVQVPTKDGKFEPGPDMYVNELD